MLLPQSLVTLVRRGELFYERGTEKPKTPLEQARLHRRALLRGQRVFANCRGIREMNDPDTIHGVGLFFKSHSCYCTFQFHTIWIRTLLYISFQRYEDAVRQVFRLDEGEDEQSQGERIVM